METPPPGNLLSAEREPWLAIDPMPVIAPAAFDAVSLVWSKRSWLFQQRNPAAVLATRVECAAHALGASPQEIRAWTLARATALLYERFSWGGYNEAPFVGVIEALSDSSVR
jgi:hypothetical protein